LPALDGLTGVLRQRLGCRDSRDESERHSYDEMPESSSAEVRFSSYLADSNVHLKTSRFDGDEEPKPGS